MKNIYRIFVLCPGVGFTKIAYYENDRKLYSYKVAHPDLNDEVLMDFEEEVNLRIKDVEEERTRRKTDLRNVDAIAVTSGGLVPLDSGIYRVNDLLLKHAEKALVRNPITLGPLMGKTLAERYEIGELYTVNPPDVDELDKEERISGFPGIYHESRGHALTQEENGRRYAAKVGRNYTELNLIIANISSGLSVVAHRHGKMCCANNSIGGDGPMSLSRAGRIPALKLVDLCFSGKYTKQEITRLITTEGGFSCYLEKSDLEKIDQRVQSGDELANMMFKTFVRQVSKEIGACAAALSGQVDAIIISGEGARRLSLVKALMSSVSWIAPIAVQAGSFESESLASGALRALRGEEIVKDYNGVPNWNPDELFKSGKEE